MPDYRAFYVNAQGRIFAGEVFEARTDAEALALGAQLVNTHDVEIWRGPKRIGALAVPAKTAALPPSVASI